MAKSLTDRISDRKRDEARAAFSGYVQSVAFNMTLSHHMVDALWAVRDFGNMWAARADNAVSKHVGSHSAPLMGALIRRGLVWHDFPEGDTRNHPPGHRYFKLTRAGELMCELLVEADLIAAQSTPNKSTNAA